jgi:hypothetical protein
MTISFHAAPFPLAAEGLACCVGSALSARSDAEGATVSGAVRAVESARLLDRKRMKALFGDAEIRTEWWFALPKSLIAIRR